VEIVAYGKFGVVWNRISRRGGENARAPKWPPDSYVTVYLVNTDAILLGFHDLVLVNRKLGALVKCGCGGMRMFRLRDRAVVIIRVKVRTRLRVRFRVKIWVRSICINICSVPYRATSTSAFCEWHSASCE